MKISITKENKENKKGTKVVKILLCIFLCWELCLQFLLNGVILPTVRFPATKC